MQSINMKRIRTLAYSLLWLPMLACAAYPDRPITIIVPFAAGGPTDVVARALQKPMGDALGQPVIIDNTAGAGGTIGTRKAVQARPDGYTILFMNLGVSTAPSLYKTLGYDPRTDLTPIGSVVDTPMAIIARKDLPPETLPQLKAWMKAQGGKVNYGHAGIGSAAHLCGVLLQKDLNTNFTEIGYKGTAPAVQALIAGEIDIICDQWSNMTEQVKAGTVKVYSTTAAVKDFPALPQYLSLSAWHALYAPKGTPPEFIEKLSSSLQSSIASEYFRTRMEQINTLPATPEQARPAALAQRTTQEVQHWGTLLSNTGTGKQ